MIKKLINIFLSYPKFNPYGLKLIDHETKFEGKVNDNFILCYAVRDEYDKWAIQLLSCQSHSDYDEFNYVDHKTFNSKPNIIQLLLTTNQLLTKNFPNEKTA